MWIEGGTRVRFADLSDDWQSKTDYRGHSLIVGPGRGHVTARGREAHWHPGIKARDFAELITEKWWSERKPATVRDFKSEVSKFFRGIVSGVLSRFGR